MTISKLTNNIQPMNEVDKINEIIDELDNVLDAANKSLSNLNSTGSNAVSVGTMPSGTYTDLTVGANGTTYTAPANGWYCINYFTSGIHNLYLINTTTGFENNASTTNGANHVVILPVRKNDVISLVYETTLDFSYNGFFRFYYAQGEV